MEEKTTEMLLEEQLKSGIRHLDDLTDGSEEKARHIDDVATLYKVKIEETKAQATLIQAENERIKNERDSEQNKAALKNERFLQIVKTGAEVLIFVGGLIFYGNEIRRGYKYEYEENGYVSSPTFKTVMNNCFGRFRMK